MISNSSKCNLNFNDVHCKFESKSPYNSAGPNNILLAKYDNTEVYCSQQRWTWYDCSNHLRPGF